MAAITDSGAPPPTPTSPTPSVASSAGCSTPIDPNTMSFKSNLQVLLKRQDTELVKNIEYKKTAENEDEESEGKGCYKEGKENGNDGEKVQHVKSDAVIKLPEERKKQRKNSTHSEIDDEKPEKRKNTKERSKKGKEEEDSIEEEKASKEKKEDPKEKDTKEKHTNTKEKDTKQKDKKEEDTKETDTKEKDTKPKDTNTKEKDTKQKDTKEEDTKETSTMEKDTQEKEAKEKDTKEKDTKEKGIKERDAKENITLETKEDKKTSPDQETKPNDESPTGGKNYVKEEPKTGKTDSKKARKEEAQQDIPPSSPKTSSPSSLLSPSSCDRKGKNIVKGNDGVAASDPISKAEKQQGILMKKGRSPFASWKKYYFVLDGKLLMYYRSENDYKSLAGAKGSLDIAMLEEVRIKKPGRMKSHFPFSISRRNLRSLNLATSTEEERVRWMSILRGTQQHPKRISGSENILNSTSTSSIPKDNQEKYATMPVRRGSSLSGESSNESEEEEPILIQPKKIVRRGPGISLDLGAVKLKKVEDSKKEEAKQTTENDKEEDTEKERTGSEKFGVKLKRAEVKGILFQSNNEKKEDGNLTTEENPGNNTTGGKRPNKQATIPLNISPCLSHADKETNKTSPETKLTNTTERKRSPSPSIPLSKGVQSFLVKSGEEPEVSDSGVSSDVNKINDVPLNTAERKEIRYSDDVLSITNVPSVNYVQVEEEMVHSEDDDLNRTENINAEISDPEDQKETIEIPQVSITIKDTSDDESEYERFDDVFLELMKQNKRSSHEGEKISTEEPSPILKPFHPESDMKDTSIDSKEHEENSEKLSTIHPKNTVQVTDKPDSLDVSGKNKGTESSITPPRSPLRLRSGTNESSNSSCKSDSESTDRKFGKFKIFQSKRPGSGDEGRQEETKERKKKTSSFSKFLPGKKNKDKNRKSVDEYPKHTQTEDSIPRSHECQEYSKRDQIGLGKDLSSEKTDVKSMVEEQPITPEIGIPHILVQEETTENEKLQQAEVSHDPIPFRAGSRCSNYSRSSTTSRDLDPPPSVPEKRGTRGTSPGYDTPQSNQRVSLTDCPIQQSEIEPEEEKKVDGMISQEQINAILSAKDNRERRRKLSSRSTGPLLAVPDSSGNKVSEDTSSPRRSITSSESDEPLPKTNFLSTDRNSSNSISSDTPSKSPEAPSEQEPTVVLRRSSRLTESLTAGQRVSLTSPEFTVMEEDVPGSPGPDKTAPKPEPEKTSHLEEAEQNDYFPIIGGGGVELRHPSPTGLLQKSSDTGIRTSGISGLKAYLEENQEEPSSNTKSGISRLGHSAAIDRLRRESGDDS